MSQHGRLVGREVKRHMSAAERLGHAVMILFTCGLWWPIYRARKSRLERTTNIYEA